METSNVDIGVVLDQEEEKKPYAIYYISKNITIAKLNYIVTEKEFLAIIYAINNFRHYITATKVFCIMITMPFVFS